jgi:hypothetical protein
MDARKCRKPNCGILIQFSGTWLRASNRGQFSRGACNLSAADGHGYAVRAPPTVLRLFADSARNYIAVEGKRLSANKPLASTLNEYWSILVELVQSFTQIENTPPLVVRPMQACAMLSIGLTRCYELMNAGELESFKEGKSRKITVSSIRAYIDRRMGARG